MFLLPLSFAFNRHLLGTPCVISRGLGSESDTFSALKGLTEYKWRETCDAVSKGEVVVPNVGACPARVCTRFGRSMKVGQENRMGRGVSSGR